MIQDSVLALTDQAVLPISPVFNAIKEIKKGGNEQTDPLVITQAALIGLSLLSHLKYLSFSLVIFIILF